MRRIIALILLYFMVLLGGCQIGRELKPSEMDPNVLPDERAFQDEFTREFLQSAEETRPGYYPFLSKTGRYEMDFPADAVIAKQGYTLKESNFETLVSGIEGKTNAGFTIFYYADSNHENIDLHLNWFQGRIGKELEFEVIESENLKIYYNNFQRNNFDKNVAYVQNLQNSGGIEIIFTVDCATINNCRKSESDHVQQEFINWIKTIKFINTEESVDK